ncbi:MAG: hypothetical protein ACOX9E_11095 [Lentisphaeria bacterium]|jgi:hypothetical protein
MNSIRRHAFAALFCSALIALRAQPISTADDPWFDQVTTPTKLTPAQIEDFCRKIHRAIAAGQDEKQLATLAPDDQSPRVLFLSLSNDLWPARTYFGCGWNFAHAWESTAAIMCANEKAYAVETAKQARGAIETAVREGKPIPMDWVAREKAPNDWNWLRLDIVQVARPSFDYSVEGSKIALTSLVGLAFGPQLGFAFPPAQLTGRCLITPERFLAKQQVANIIAETYNWGAIKNWLRLSAVEEGHRICLFEVDSYCSDGVNVVRLYRGHPIAQLPDNDQCLDAATRCAELLINYLDPAKGTLNVPFPEWIASGDSSPGADNREALDAQAELVIALARLAQSSNNKKHFADGAALAAKPLQLAMRRYGQQKDFIALIEKEPIAADSHLEPRLITTLRSNATACLAFIELSAIFPDNSDYPAIATAIGRHLHRQAQPGNGFIPAKFYPSDQIYESDESNDYGQAETEAMAALALAKLGKKDRNGGFLEVADNNLAYLLSSKIQLQELTATVTSPWLAEALDQYYRRNNEYISQLSRLALAASIDQNTEPLFPDLFGAVHDWESMTTAAERSWLLASLSKTLRDCNQTSKAADAMADAAAFLCFQYQARIDRATAAALSRPQYYVNFFRDHLEDFGYDLNGQATQIISLLAIRRELMDGYGGQFPKLEQFKEKLAAAQRTIDTHPLPLSVELVIRRTIDDSADGRDLLGGIPKRGAVNFRGKGGKIVPAEEAVSSGVVKRKRRGNKSPAAPRK